MPTVLVIAGPNGAGKSTMAPGLTDAVLWPRRVRQRGSPDVSVARVHQRHLEGGHGIPEAVVRRRYERSLSNFFELYVPLAHQWIVLANREVVPSHVVDERTDPEQTVIYNAEEWAAMRSALRDDNI